MKTRIIGNIVFLLFLSIISLCAQTPVLKADGGTPEFMYPKTGASYSLTPGTTSSSGNVSLIDWTVSGGSFNETSSQTTVSNVKTTMTVFWDNVPSTSPKGMLKAVVSYTTGAKKPTSCEQKILTLKGANTPELIYSKSTNIDWGQQTLSNVKLSADFLFPGGSNINVDQYEWTLPNGWRTNDNKSGTFIVNSSSITIITSAMGVGTVKVRGVNKIYTADKSEYSSLTFTRNLSFQSYPKASEIKYGAEQTFAYSVTPASGCTFEWSLPFGWSIASGTNTNSVSLKKSICSTSADVKVRVVSGSERSDWYTCPNTAMTYPGITPIAITQYAPVNIALDIPAANVQAFSISGDGIYIISGQGTKSVTCQFNKSGNIAATISLTVAGCGTTQYQKIISVAAASKPSISGPTAIENGSSFSIPGVLPGIGIQWNISGYSGLTINSSGVVSLPAGRREDGLATITATFGGLQISKVCNIYANYVDGYWLINGSRYNFYAGEPDHNPEFGVSAGTTLDIYITTPKLDGNKYLWSVQSGSDCLDAFNTTGMWMCHIVTRSGASGLVKIELTVNYGNEPLKQLINLYVNSYYLINKLSTSSISIKRQKPENIMQMLSHNPVVTSYQYQIIQIGTGIVCLNGTCPVSNEYLEIDTSGLRPGAYTVVITEDGKVKHHQTMMF